MGNNGGEWLLGGGGGAPGGIVLTLELSKSKDKMTENMKTSCRGKEYWTGECLILCMAMRKQEYMYDKVCIEGGVRWGQMTMDWGGGEITGKLVGKCEKHTLKS